MGLHESVAAKHMKACELSTFSVLSELVALLPEVRQTLSVILTTPIPVGDNTEA
jgi:hypothetical protein